MDIQKFQIFLEATISKERVESGIEYIPNNSGVKCGLAIDLVLTPIKYISIEPIKQVSLVNSSSYRPTQIDLTTNILKDYAIYKGSDGLYYGVKYGSNSIIVQKERTGSSKRGDYIKELVFCMQLYKSLCDKGLDNENLLIYNGDVPYTKSKEELNIFVDDTINKWYSENKEKKIPLIEQCELFLSLIGSDKCNSIIKIVNSTTDYSLLKLVNRLSKDNVDRFNVAKWNPSDVWIVFDNFNDTEYFENFTGDIYELKSFIDNNIDMDYHFDKFVGISLKLPVDKNIDIEIKNRGERGKESNFKYRSVYSFKPDNMTIVLPYSYKKFGDKIDSTIDIRKFNTSNVTVAPEVKTTGGSQIGGKANVQVALGNDELFKNYNSFKSLVYDKEDAYGKTRKYLQTLDPNTVDSNHAYNDMFYVLNHCDKIIGHKESSQLLSLYLLFLVFENNDINGAIERIVKYAKSISDWSSAYIVLK